MSISVINTISIKLRNYIKYNYWKSSNKISNIYSAQKSDIVLQYNQKESKQIKIHLSVVSKISSKLKEEQS